MKRNFYPFALALCLIAFLSCNSESDNGHDPSLQTSYHGIKPPVALQFRVVEHFPHDTSAFTQGLQLYNGILYEGTGDYHESSLRATDLKTGKVLQKHLMGSDKIFGEGITILNDTLYQLTWQSNIVYVYTLDNITKPVKTMNWPYEGWGITNNGKDLIISDGSANLYFVNPADFRVLNTVRVADHRGNIRYLNELEYVNGKVYANVFETFDIIEIDPESGQVTGRITLNNLLTRDEITPRTDLFNGIAYDSATNSLLVTGKRWPKVFRVQMN